MEGENNTNNNNNAESDLFSAFEGCDLLTDDTVPQEVSSISAVTVEEGDCSISDQELQDCIRTLKKLQNKASLLDTKKFKELRVVGRELFITSLGQKFYGGLDSKENYDYKSQSKKNRKRKKNLLKVLDKQIREKSEIRKARTEAMLQLERNLSTIEGGETNVEQVAHIKLIEAPSEGDENLKFLETTFEESTYIYPKSCYICKTRYLDKHHYYDLLCPSCANKNWDKRNQRVDLKGRIAIVTGGRVKIGFETVLKLLRDGAEVIVTTRFPQDAVIRYTEQPDFSDWKDKLHICGLDLRDLSAVEKFTEYIISHFSHLDIIINNASQTVRRPPIYYQHLLEKEYSHVQNEEFTTQHLIDFNFITRSPNQPPAISHNHTQTIFNPQIIDCTDDKRDCNNNNNNNIENEKRTSSVEENKNSDNDVLEERGDELATQSRVTKNNSFHVISHPDKKINLQSFELSQFRLIEEDFNEDVSKFPTGVLDCNKQQVDLREKNSWIMKLHEVSTIELVEVHAINALSPFILNAKLKPLMLLSPFSERFIINVSAMEGKFTRYKTPHHPHTNMAKASSNMMTRTSAVDYKEDNIYMNSVDTGWITDENPFEAAVKYYNIHKFQPPIDEVDAAARILDPIYGGLLSGTFESGKFFKDYTESTW